MSSSSTVIQSAVACGGLLFLEPSAFSNRDHGAQPAAAPMRVSVYDLHAANAAARLDQLTAYAGHTLRRLLMVANDPFLTEEATRRGLDVVSFGVEDVEQDALGSLPEGALDAAVFSAPASGDPEAALRQVRRALKPSGAVPSVTDD